MKALAGLAFGLLALVAANFATAAPAKADSFGVYVGSHGFGIQVHDYDRRHYRHRGCWDRYYQRYVLCNYNYGYYRSYPRYNYYNDYRHRWNDRRGHRYNNHWRGNDRWRDNDRWRGRHDGRRHRDRHRRPDRW